MRREATSLIAFLILSCGASMADVFTWPAGISNAGPYTLISGIQSQIVVPVTAANSIEGDLSTHKYRHHTRIAFFKGLIALAFSSGCTNEADGGMQTAFVFSTNKGSSWSSPVLVCPSMSAWNNIPVMEGARIAYPRDFETYNGKLYLISAIDQHKSYGGGTNVIGVALVAREVMINGVLGDLFRISTTACTNVDNKTVPDYDSTLGPPLLSLSKVYGTWGGNYVAWSPGEWNGWLQYHPDANYYNYCEPNTFSQDGGSASLYRIWRIISGDTYSVAMQSSLDGGLNWSSPTNTTIPNAPSETTGLRLSDGRFAICGNARNTTGQIRDPLFLAITAPNSLAITNVYSIRQGISGAPTYPGWAKDGGASYAHAVQVGNYLYVSYSMQKESIGFSRVLIPGLPDNNNDDWPPHVVWNASTVRSANLRSQ